MILVSHDRDFIDRLATSTIALDGNGKAVETPGGWSDFVSQNPGFFRPVATAVARPIAAPRPAPPPPARAATKLSYKDQRRLEELEGLIEALPGRIAELEGALADPDLYTRDPAGFARTNAVLEAARAELSAAEDEWFALEEKKAALAGG